MNQIEKSTLYIVSTPIGNLGDITYRAVEVLKGVDVIACEDTRHSKKLLTHYEIKNRVIAYHSYNEENSANGIISLLNSGNSVALVSDGGTPCISDPGVFLVKKCIESGINVIPIPGASALLSALVSSGFRTDKFSFIGFLSPKSGKRKNQLTESKNFEGTIVLYESPYRILKLIEDVCEVFPDKNICVIKELTKINEKKTFGAPKETLEILTKEKILGEFVLLIANY